MKYINYAFSNGEFVKGFCDEIYQGEHNSTTLRIYTDSERDYTDCHFTLKFHTSDCRRYSFTVDRDESTNSISFLIPSLITVAGILEFELDLVKKSSDDEIEEIEQLFCSSFVINHSVGFAEEGDSEYIDLFTLFEEKYRKAKDELTNLLQDVIINLLQDAATDLDDTITSAENRISAAIGNIGPTLVTLINNKSEEISESLRRSLIRTVSNFPTEIPNGFIKGDFGGFHMLFYGNTVKESDIKHSKGIIVVKDNGGKIKSVNLTPAVSVWDSLEIYKEGYYILPTNKSNGMTLYSNTETHSVYSSSGWSKVSGNGYVDFVNENITVDLFSGSSLPAVIAKSYDTIAKNGLPAENSWAITVDDDAHIVFRYNGAFSGDADDFVEAISNYDTTFIIRKLGSIIPYNIDIDISAGDTVEVLKCNDNPTLYGSITYFAYPYDEKNNEEILNPLSASKTVTVGSKAIKLPDDILSDYVILPSNFDIICRSRNIFTPLYFESSISKAKNIKRIYVSPDTKYYLGIYGNSGVTPSDITVKEFSANGTVVAVTNLDDFAFKTTSSTKYLIFEVNISSQNLNKLKITLSDEGVLPESDITYREFPVVAFLKDGNVKYKINIIKGGELTSTSPSSYNVDVVYPIDKKEVRLCEWFRNDYPLPYGTVSGGKCKIKVFGATENYENFSGRLIIHNGKNQYDPYIKRVSGSASFQNRTFAKNLGDGWINVYHRTFDSFRIKDDEFTKLVPNKTYSISVDFEMIEGTQNFAINMIDSNGQATEIGHLNRSSNNVWGHFTAPSDGICKFLFRINDGTSSSAEANIRVSIAMGKCKPTYSEYRKPTIIELPELSSSMQREIDCDFIHLESGGFVEIESDTSAVGYAEICCENEYKLLAKDVLANAIALYNREYDMNYKSIDGVREYRFIAERGDNCKITDRYSSSPKTSISESASIGYGGSLVADDIITIFAK